MIFLLLAQVWSVLLDLIWLTRRAERDKDIEILLLRQQLGILQRKHAHPPRISRWEKLTLLVLVGKLTALTNNARARLAQVVFLFKPETLLKWHRELVRRKWTYRKGVSRGRPAIVAALEALILRLAKENPTWGYGKLEGELGKLGFAIGRSTIRTVLKRHQVPVPATAVIRALSARARRSRRASVIVMQATEHGESNNPPALTRC